MKIAFHLNNQRLKHTSSDFYLINSIFKAGHEVFFFYDSISQTKTGVFAYLQKILSININNRNQVVINATDPKIVGLEEMDILFIRKDPPFDMSYITYTYMLDSLSKSTLVLNSPAALRNYSEKLSIFNFQQHMIDTIVTQEISMIEKFVKIHHKCIIKPLYSCAGEDIFILETSDTNMKAIIELMINKYKQPVMVQKYIEDIDKHGDKRIILVDGKAIGCFSRLKTKSAASNMAAGGKIVKSSITYSDEKIINDITPFLIRNNIFFAGIDIIGSYLTEINITSPTGLHQIDTLNNTNNSSYIVNAIESIYQRHKNN